MPGMYRGRRAGCADIVQVLTLTGNKTHPRKKQKQFRFKVTVVSTLSRLNFF